MSKLSISVIFITKNEEFHIGSAIENVKDFAADVFVVDSGSTDNTVEIAKAKGAKVLYHPFEGFGKQWNWALDNCPIKTKWTMKMDPDERVTAELKQEISTALEEECDYMAYQMSWQVYFMGRPVKTRSYYFTRLWKTGSGRFSDVLVNEHFLVSGRLRKFRGKLVHLDAKDLTAWLDKQNRYTAKTALAYYKSLPTTAHGRLFGSELERREFFCELFRNLPFRYFLIFWYYFIFTGAWRSGADGWRWAQMRTFVLRLWLYKAIEMRNLECATK